MWNCSTTFVTCFLDRDWSIGVNKSMDRDKLFKIGSALFLTAAGLFLIFASKEATVRTGTVNAQAGIANSYTTEWKATKILTVDATVVEDPADVQVGEAGIGVWGWQVTGNSEDGTLLFEETWIAPSIGGVSFGPRAEGCDISGDITLLLAGCFADQNNLGGGDTSKYTFAVRGLNEFNGKESRINVNNNGDQKSNSCINSPRNESETECLIQSGSYNFQHLYEPGFDGRSRWIGGGTLMPLKWTVSGRIY